MKLSFVKEFPKDDSQLGAFASGCEVTCWGCGITQSGGGTIGNPYTYSVAAESVNRPVSCISWGDVVRFTNWLNNGQPTGAQNLSSTEDGAYFLNGAITDAELMAATRKAGAKYWLPSENEWYKAAYYKGGSTNAGYWLYPTKSNDAPGRDMSESTNPGNNANYLLTFSSTPYPIESDHYTTVAGEFQLSVSPYGTFGQGDNVWEWNETAVDSSGRGLRGGSFDPDGMSGLVSSCRPLGCFPSFDSYGDFGFRLAGVPMLVSWLGGISDTKTAWGETSNWDANFVPDYTEVKVVFGNQSAANNIVDLVSAGRTVGSMSFVPTTSTTIRSTYGFALTLDNNGRTSTIEVEGNHTIIAPVILNNNVEISGSGTLELSGGICGNYILTVLGTLNATSIQVDTLCIGSVGANAVPEPGSFAMLLSIAAGGLLWWKRRKAYVLFA